MTVFGLLAGLAGSLSIALTSAILLPICPNKDSGSTWESSIMARERIVWVLFITLWGGLGSVVDSLLGGWLQASVVDVRSGKVIEGSGGRKVCLIGSTSMSIYYLWYTSNV